MKDCFYTKEPAGDIAGQFTVYTNVLQVLSKLIKLQSFKY